MPCFSFTKVFTDFFFFDYMHEFASSYAPLLVVVILVAVTWFLIAHEACWCLIFLGD